MRPLLFLLSQQAWLRDRLWKGFPAEIEVGYPLWSHSGLLEGCVVTGHLPSYRHARHLLAVVANLQMSGRISNNFEFDHHCLSARQQLPHRCPNDTGPFNHRRDLLKPFSSGDVDASASHSGRCTNCRRLNFDCRWVKPRRRETFNPPPKRRKVKSRDGESASDVDPQLESETSCSLLAFPTAPLRPQVKMTPSVPVEPQPNQMWWKTDGHADLMGDDQPCDWNFGLDWLMPGNAIFETAFPDLTGSSFGSEPLSPSVSFPSQVGTVSPHHHPPAHDASRYLIQHYLEVGHRPYTPAKRVTEFSGHERIRQSRGSLARHFQPLHLSVF